MYVCTLKAAMGTERRGGSSLCGPNLLDYLEYAPLLGRGRPGCTAMESSRVSSADPKPASSGGRVPKSQNTRTPVPNSCLRRRAERQSRKDERKKQNEARPRVQCLAPPCGDARKNRLKDQDGAPRQGEPIRPALHLSQNELLVSVAIKIHPSHLGLVSSRALVARVVTTPEQHPVCADNLQARRGIWLPADGQPMTC